MFEKNGPCLGVIPQHNKISGKNANNGDDPEGTRTKMSFKKVVQGSVNYGWDKIRTCRRSEIVPPRKIYDPILDKIEQLNKEEKER